jgi:hypothetical protein
MTAFRHTASVLLASLAASGFAGAAGPAPAGEAAPQAVLFAAQSRIEVDATGAVTAVAPTPGLPEAVNAALANNLRSLRFTPAMKDGRAVGGVTYARQEACAIPDGGNYRLAVKFFGNGPGGLEGGDKASAPRYPSEALRAGASAEVKLVYVVGPDGSIAVESAELAKGRSRYTKDFIAASRDWLEGRQASPESLDGQAVATRVETTVKYTLGPSFSGPNARKQSEAHARETLARMQEERIANNGACTEAARAREDRPQQVAINSPFKLVATP